MGDIENQIITEMRRNDALGIAQVQRIIRAYPERFYPTDEEEIHDRLTPKQFATYQKIRIDMKAKNKYPKIIITAPEVMSGWTKHMSFHNTKFQRHFEVKLHNWHLEHNPEIMWEQKIREDQENNNEKR